MLTLFSSPRCSLCEPVKEVLLEAVESSNGSLSLSIVDITQKENKKWFFQYQFDIPVVHLDGIEIARHRLSKHDLANVLKRD